MMKIKNLQIKRAARAVLIGLLLGVAGVTKAGWAVAAAFSLPLHAVDESGRPTQLVLSDARETS